MGDSTADEAALEEMVRGLAPRLLRYCLGATRVVETAEEVAQEALASLVDRWRRHGAPDFPEGFAFAVARRRAQRARWRARLAAPLAALGDGREAGLAAPAPDAAAAARIELRRALAAIDRLPARDREALLLAAAGELSSAEGARVLGISPSAFKMRLHRARARLTDNLEAGPWTDETARA